MWLEAGRWERAHEAAVRQKLTQQQMQVRCVLARCCGRFGAQCQDSPPLTLQQVVWEARRWVIQTS